MVAKGKKETVTCGVEMSESIDAPVEADQVVGEINVYCDGGLIGTYEIKASEAVEKLNFKLGLEQLLRSLVGA